MTSLSLYTKIENLPPALKQEATDFVEFLITKSKIVKTSEIQSNTNKPIFGALKGKIHTSPDFDEPLDDFNDYI